MPDKDAYPPAHGNTFEHYGLDTSAVRNDIEPAEPVNSATLDYTRGEQPIDWVAERRAAMERHHDRAAESLRQFYADIDSLSEAEHPSGA
jgi:hypothetical protein